MAKRFVLIDDTDAGPEDVNLEQGPLYTPDALVGDAASLLDAYSGLMEQVIWGHRIGVDEYGDPEYAYSAASVIWFTDIRMIRNAASEALQQFAYIMTTSAIAEGDVIVRNGYTWPVIGIQSTPGWAGEAFRVGNLGERQI